MKQTICALVLGVGLLPLETEARPSKLKRDSINPEVRAIVEYVLKNPATIVKSESAYSISSDNCGKIGDSPGCRSSGTRNTFTYTFTINEQKVMILYQDFDSTRIQSDGKISPEDYLTITQRRNIHQSFPSSTEFTDNGLDGIVDDSFGIFSKEEIGMEEADAIQKEYESVLKEVGEYISRNPLKK